MTNREKCVNWIKEYFKDNPDGKAIIGISGGKDSTIEAAGDADINVLNKFTFGYYELPLDILDEASDRADEIESIEVVGLCTDVCVISNAMILKSCFMVAPIVVDSSCCAGVTPESHQNALNAMKMCQIDVT